MSDKHNASSEEYWGAEAILKKGNWLGYEILKKIRVAKKYRIKEIDNELRKNRTITESRLMIFAKRIGVKTPYIFEIDLENMIIIMEEIHGQIIKNLLNSSFKEKEKLVETIGYFVGKLHSSDIIHGDLTTSNIMKRGDDIIFIDFGLGKFSQSIEDKAVDILLLKKCFISTHTDLSEKLFFSFQKGYMKTMKNSQTVFKRAIKVEARGRHLKEDQVSKFYLIS